MSPGISEPKVVDHFGALTRDALRVQKTNIIPELQQLLQREYILD